MTIEALKHKSSKAQWAFIRKVVSRDANGRGELYDGKSRYCVVGGLARALGWDGVMNDASSEAFAYDTVYAIPVLGTQRVDSLIDVNDDYDKTRPRRAALLKIMREWELDDVDDPL